MTTIEAKTGSDFLVYDRTIGVAAMQGRGFYYPWDNAIAPDGRLYVLGRGLDGDPRGVRVTVLDLEEEYRGTFGSYGRGDGQFIWPSSIAIDTQQKIFISDEYLHRVTVLDMSGKFLSTWGTHGSDDGELNGPSGIAFDKDDDVYVVDHQNGRIQKFTNDGEYLFQFGSQGSDAGELYLPWGICLDAQGDVYVADWGNDRIQKFSPEGKFLTRFGASGRGDGHFYRPASVCVDGEGYIYVADWGNERVQVLDRNGEFVIKLRGEATLSRWAHEFLDTNIEEREARSRANLEPKLEFLDDDPHEESAHIEKLFWAPTSVKLDGSGRLFVVESNRHRLQVYARGSSG